MWRSSLSGTLLPVPHTPTGARLPLRGGWAVSNPDRDPNPSSTPRSNPSTHPDPKPNPNQVGRRLLAACGAASLLRLAPCARADGARPVL